MVTHHSKGLNSSSCGRTGVTLTTTEDRSQVSCKTCLRSLEKVTASPAPEAYPVPVIQLNTTAAPAAGAPQRKAQQLQKLSASASWRHRIAQIPGRNRLPRGARQVYI